VSPSCEFIFNRQTVHSIVLPVRKSGSIGFSVPGLQISLKRFDPNIHYPLRNKPSKSWQLVALEGGWSEFRLLANFPQFQSLWFTSVNGPNFGANDENWKIHMWTKMLAHRITGHQSL
jgi:hypothetical protein